MKQDLNSIINKLRQLLPNFPIKKAWLFGSYATGEANDDSDVDLLVNYDKSPTFTLFTIVDIKEGLCDGLGLQVDLVEEGRLLPYVERQVNNEKILIYERGA